MSVWSVGSVKFSLPYMFGAGVCKTPETTAQWLKIAGVVSGSYTLDPRPGNEGSVLWPESFADFLESGYGLNAYGMPNEGCARASKKLLSLDSEYPLIASVAGLCVDNFISAAKVFEVNPKIDAIEFNCGCPNTQGEHSEIISFNLEDVRSILTQLVDSDFSKPVWLKFSPFSNPVELHQMAKMIEEFSDDLEIAVVTCNTFPNAYAGKGNIDTNKGMAGMSGKALKPIALGNVLQFRECLPAIIPVVGVGGMTVADDILDFLDAGASMVQVTSAAHWAGDPGSFNDHFFDPENADRFLKFMLDRTQ